MEPVSRAMVTRSKSNEVTRGTFNKSNLPRGAKLLRRLKRRGQRANEHDRIESHQERQRVKDPNDSDLFNKSDLNLHFLKVFV
jgi:hypothetical protein